MITVNRQGPEAMADNPKPGARQQYVDRGGEYRPAAAPPADSRVILARGLVALVLFLVATVVYFAWRIPTCWRAPCVAIRAAEPVAFAALLCGAPVLAALGYGLAWWLRQCNTRDLERAEIARTTLTLDRFGNPVSAAALTALPVDAHMELYWRALVLATEAKIRTAPYEQLPQGLNSLSSPPQIPAQVAVANVPAALDVGPLAPDVWLAWLDKQPHALLAAKTGAGKSTLAKAGLKPRIEAGEQVFIIDPHSNGWFDLPGVGGGENWTEIEAAMRAVVALYHERLGERERYRQETGQELSQHHFPRLTVVFDEANNARDAFDRHYSGPRRRDDPWPLFARCLGSGARKVGIAVWLLAQSALVEDIGLSGAMRQNFTRFALDDYTIRQMVDREERQAERKKAIYAALPGLSFPATAIVEAEVYLLDRAGLDQVPPPRDSRAASWAGWQLPSRRILTPAASVRPDDTLRASVAVPAAPADGRTADGRVYRQERIKLYLTALARQGQSREQARSWAEAHGLRFENSLWTEVRRDAGLT